MKENSDRQRKTKQMNDRTKRKDTFLMRIFLLLLFYCFTIDILLHNFMMLSLCTVSELAVFRFKFR